MGDPDANWYRQLESPVLHQHRDLLINTPEGRLSKLDVVLTQGENRIPVFALGDSGPIDWWSGQWVQDRITRKLTEAGIR